MALELDAPNVGELEKRYLAETIDSGFVSTFGPYVTEFERRFAEYLKVEKAVSTQSGTAALHVALHEMGISKGDEVIVPAVTFVATANSVMYAGAIPVFADVDGETWNISPDEIAALITPRTKAVIPVHLYGNPCAMDRIMEIAEERGIFVVEDAAQSLGATFGGRHTGTFGHMGCFSFNGNKTITTGGGGMVTSRDRDRVEHIKFLVNQAREDRGGYFHPEIGFNYRMTNLEASMGLAQMERLGELLEKKRKIHAAYRKELEGRGGISFQKEYGSSKSSWWFTCVLFGEDADIPGLQAALKDEGIPTRRAFIPIAEFPPYKDCRKGSLGNSYCVYERGLCLPSSTLNSLEEIHYVCDRIKELI